MTLKSTRGSNIVLFICSPGRALTLRDSLSTAERGPWQENFAFGTRSIGKYDTGSQPRGRGMCGHCPLPPGRDPQSAEPLLHAQVHR